MQGKLEKDHWHPAFVGAMEIEFIEYKDILEFDEEHQLSREPLKMDLLVIKKDPKAEIKNEIGQIFRQFNIFEYKSPDDGLTIDDYIKTIGYAYIYKGLGKTVDAVPFNELTVTMIRDNMPTGLFNKIRELGGTTEEVFPGIFYLKGIVNIPTQFVLTSKLDKFSHTSLRILTKRATEDDVERFVEMVSKFTEPGDRQNADALLQVSVSANREIFESVKRRNPTMCEAMRDLMKDEILEEIQEAEQKAVELDRVMSIRSLMENLHLTAKEAMDALNIPLNEQPKYAASV